jgi:hypothetical protein
MTYERFSNVVLVLSLFMFTAFNITGSGISGMFNLRYRQHPRFLGAKHAYPDIC